MEERNLEQKILDYLDGKVSKEEALAFENRLEADKNLQKEVDELKSLTDAFSAEEMVKPSEKLTANFEKMLEQEKKNQVKVVSLTSHQDSGRFQVLRIAASIALLIGVFIIGRYSGRNEVNTSLVEAQQEVLEYKEATLISLLGNESASKRIQGVQLVKEFDRPDKDIVAALGEKMLADENTNVRLSAMEALSKFSYSEQVKSIFIQALETEENPSIQVALIKILGQLQEKKAIEPLKKLLEKEDTQPFIKNEINNALPKII